MAESTQIRIDLDVKARLETYRDFKRVKSHSDAISFALNETIDLNGSLDRLKYQMLEDKNVADREAVYVGDEIKNELRLISDDFGLYSEVKVIQFLLHHYNNSQSFTKETMKYVCELKPSYIR